MRRKWARGITMCVLLFQVLSARGGTFEYQCVATQEHSVVNGRLEPKKAGAELTRGQKFVVSRETGEIVGGAMALNRRQGWKVLDVVDRGSAEQSFKLLAISSGRNTHVIYLEIKEFEPGPEKSFVHYSLFNVTTGTCR